MFLGRSLQTGRLVLTPVAWTDLADLQRLKTDPLVFAQMLGGVRSPSQVTAELAEDLSFWARHNCGMWIVRDAVAQGGGQGGGQGEAVAGVGGRGQAYGITGLHERPDGRGPGLRFAFTPASRGRGFAREAAGAALRHAHDQAGIPRVVAVAKEGNFNSRMVLGAIGMRECDAFDRAGERMLVFESVR